MSDNLNEKDIVENEIQPDLKNFKKNDTIVDKVIEFFTGFTSEERIKLRKLKEINRELKKGKYNFYSYKGDMILPQFPKFFYELFRMSQNFIKFLDVKNHSTSIKILLFDIFSSERQKKIKAELEPANITEFIKSSADKAKAIEHIKVTMNEYVKSFTPDMVHKINTTFNQITDLSNIISFDWFFMLRKFDSEVGETNFNYKPVFEQIEGKYILDELVNLNDYLETIDFQKDWKLINEYIKKVSNDEGLQKILTKFIQLCMILKRDRYISNIIKLIYKDPYFEHKKFSSNAKIVQDYLTGFQLEIKKSVDKVIGDIKKENIHKLLLEIFSKITIVRLKNYNERKNELLEKKGAKGFRYIDPLNYLKAFLLDFCKGEIKPRIDTIIIRGTWSTNSASSEYSELLLKFNKVSDSLLEFDNNNAEEESYGKTIRQIAFAVGHDPNAKNLLAKAVYKIDSEALKIINDGVKLLNYSLIKIKELIDDYKLKSPKIIIDFHKIQWDFPEKFDAEMEEISKKIQKFIALLKYYVKEAGDEPVKE